MKRMCRENRQGQSMVETALVLPVLLLFITAIMDFGLLFNSYLVVGNASREGARKASVGGTDAQIISTVLNVSASLDSSKITVAISPDETAGRSAGDAVTVRVEYEYSMLTPIVAAIVPGPFRLEAATTMRCE